MLISFLHATFMKIGENDSAHELAKMLQASSKFNFIYLFIFDDLNLQNIESISPKASVENSSAQWAIFQMYEQMLKPLYFLISQDLTIPFGKVWLREKNSLKLIFKKFISTKWGGCLLGKGC